MNTAYLEEVNPWEAQVARSNVAARKLNLDEGLWKILREPGREIIVHIPVQIDDGTVESFGYKIIGVSKSTGGLYNGNGMDVNALWMYYKRNNSIEGFTGAEEADPAELLLRESEILIPAAAENQITSRNADRVKARILCEGANGPTTANADDILADKRVFVIPDILANSGGVTVSYFEWVQDRQGYFWLESEINDQLDHTMRTSFAEVLQYAEAHDVSNRIAAYMLAIDRVAYTLRQRGIYA